MRTFYCIFVFAFALFASAQDFSWKTVRNSQDKQWFLTPLASQIVDTIIFYQLPNGGWPKNQDWVNGVDNNEIEQARKTGIGATIDNGATYEELEFLARFYDVNKKNNIVERLDKVKDAYVKGVDYILEAQYDNGGWPQFYPPKKMKNGIDFFGWVVV